MMASKRRIRRKACLGKVKHATANYAMIALRKIGFGQMNIYKCPFCKQYHIGHRSRKRTSAMTKELFG